MFAESVVKLYGKSGKCGGNVCRVAQRFFVVETREDVSRKKFLWTFKVGRFCEKLRSNGVNFFEGDQCDSRLREVFVKTEKSNMKEKKLHILIVTEF